MLGTKQLIDVLDTAAAEAAAGGPRLGKRASEWVRLNAPYTLRQLPTGKLIALNRACKPLGVRGEDRWVQCESCIHLGVPRDRLDLSAWPRPCEGDVFLYDERTAPYRSRSNLRAYVQRLATVLKTVPQPNAQRLAA
jgi:hypothetical protein